MGRSPYLRLLVPGEAVAPTAGTVEAAFRANASYMAALALRILAREADVEDLLQDIYLAALRDLRDLRSPPAVRQWFATATIRLARRRLRRRRLFALFGSDDYRYEQIAAPGASPEQRALLASVYALLGRQPADQRIAWSLRHIEGMELEQIGRLCGCSLATVKRRIARAERSIEAAVGDG